MGEPSTPRPHRRVLCLPLAGLLLASGCQLLRRPSVEVVTAPHKTEPSRVEPLRLVPQTSLGADEVIGLLPLDRHRKLVAATRRGILRVLDLESGKLLRTMTLGEQPPIRSIAVSPRDPYLLAVRGSFVDLIDLERGRRLRRFRVSLERRGQAPAAFVALERADRYFLRREVLCVRLLRAQRLRHYQRARCPGTPGFPEPIVSAAFSWDGRLVQVRTWRRRAWAIDIWEPEAKKLLLTLYGRKRYVPLNRRPGGLSRTQADLIVWTMERQPDRFTTPVRGQGPAGCGRPRLAAVSPDDEVAVALMGEGAEVIHLRTGERLFRLGADTPCAETGDKVAAGEEVFPGFGDDLDDVLDQASAADSTGEELDLAGYAAEAMDAGFDSQEAGQQDALETEVAMGTDQDAAEPLDFEEVEEGGGGTEIDFDFGAPADSATSEILEDSAGSDSSSSEAIDFGAAALDFAPVGDPFDGDLDFEDIAGAQDVAGPSGKALDFGAGAASSRARGATISPDGQAALIEYAQALAVWSLVTGKEIGRIETVGPHALFARGQRLIVAPGGGPPQLWDVATGEPLRVLDRQVTELRAVALSPAGKLAVAGDVAGRVWLWDLDSLTLSFRVNAHPAPVAALAVAPDGRSLASADTRGGVRLWEIPTGRELFVLAPSEDAAFSSAEPSRAPPQLWYSPGGDHLRSCGPVQACSEHACPWQLSEWSTTSGEWIRTMSVEADAARCVPQGDLLLAQVAGVTATGEPGPPQTVVWETAHGRVLRHLPGAPLAVYRDSTRVAVSVRPRRRAPSIEIWDVRAGKVLRQFAGEIGRASQIWPAADGRHALVQTPVGLHWGDLEEQKGLRLWKRARVHSAAIADDGRLALVARDDGTLCLWRLDTGDRVTLVVSDPQWLMLTQEGHFHGSEKGDELAVGVRGLDPVPAPELSARRRPDLIRQLLGAVAP